MEAVVLASMLVICLTTALLFRLVQRKCGNVLIAIGVTVVAAAGCSIHWLARPHLFTLLFVVVFYSILERARDGNTRLLILLPFLTVLWTNLHGGFFVGIVLIGTYAAGELASVLVEPQAEQRKGALARSKPYVLTALGCAGASLLNPYSYHLHVHMYRFLTGSFQFRYVYEYQSISFQGPIAMWFEPFVLIGAMAAAWSLYRKRFAYTFLILGWVHLALFSARNIPIFMIVAAPVIAQTLHELLSLLARSGVGSWLRRAAATAEDIGAEIQVTDRLPRLHLVSAGVLLVLGAVLYAPNAPFNFQAEYDPKKYPAGALEALRGPEFASSVFTHDEWGDYLIYRLYPNTKVFVDGRCDFYGAKFEEKFIDVLNVKYGWEKTLERYGVNTVLLPVDASLAGALKESKWWRPIYDDGIAIVFRSTAMLARLAEREGASAVAFDSRIFRDRKITKTQNRDPRITKSNTRSEPL
jgi:hypothetical protein